MKKSHRKAYFFWAAWDNNFFKKYNDFKNEAKRLHINYETVDVEDPEGVRMSIKYGVRNVPAIVIVQDNKVIGFEKGNNAYTKLENYFA